MKNEETVREEIATLEEWILWYKNSMNNLENMERIITLSEHIVKDGNKRRLLLQVLRG